MGQYVLDNFATVADAVAALTATPLRVVTAQVPGEERLATVHLAMSDASGDSAIVEYIAGDQVIHHSRDYQVMTNSPIFDKQLAITEYWEEIGGGVMLPGTNRAADRFVRASFYINAVPKTADPLVAVAAVFSVVRNASTPYGIATSDEPNISTTRWRTVIDHTAKRYFFESALSPNTFWVELDNLDFTEGAQTKRLTLGEGEKTVYAGDASASSRVRHRSPFSVRPRHNDSGDPSYPRTRCPQEVGVAGPPRPVRRSPAARCRSRRATRPPPPRSVARPSGCRTPTARRRRRTRPSDGR